MFKKIGFTNKWSVISFFLIILILMPSVFILIGFFNPISDTWLHIRRYLLKDYIYNSVILVFLQVCLV